MHFLVMSPCSHGITIFIAKILDLQQFNLCSKRMISVELQNNSITYNDAHSKAELINKAIAIGTNKRVVIMAINKLYPPTGGK